MAAAADNTKSTAAIARAGPANIAVALMALYTEKLRGIVVHHERTYFRSERKRAIGIDHRPHSREGVCASEDDLPPEP
jgi:hypothetical protein